MSGPRDLPTIDDVLALLLRAADGLDVQSRRYDDDPTLLHFWADHEFMAFREGRADVAVYASNGDELLLSFQEVDDFLMSLPRDN